MESGRGQGIILRGGMMTTPDGQTSSNIVPPDANTGCPGVSSSEAGRQSSCEGCPNQSKCKSGEAAEKQGQAYAVIEERMSEVNHTILVLSGKGGVGKSTVAASIAWNLAQKGFMAIYTYINNKNNNNDNNDDDVGDEDANIPKMLGVSGMTVQQSSFGWEPVMATSNLCVMSIGFLLNHPDDAVIWRGPRKDALIRQFLSQVNWGALDYLIIDTPPGTSDEHISTAQYLAQTRIEGAVIVTTPQDVSLSDVRKEITFCRKVGIPILGVIENMKGLTVPMPMAVGDKEEHQEGEHAAAAVGAHRGDNAALKGTIKMKSSIQIIDMVFVLYENS
eukprot:jgi/Bigna1/80910/fgenesh1_pg.75_\